MAIDEGLTIDGLSVNDITNYVLERLEFTPARKKIELVGSADSDGKLPVDEVHYTNAEFLLRVRVVQQATMDLALAKIGSLTDKLQKAEVTEGGIPVVWTPADSTKSATWFAISGEIDGILTEVAGEDAGWFVKMPLLVIRLVCRPFGYGTETSVAEVISTDPLFTLSVPSVAGDVPAEGRLVITDNAAQNRAHVEWGLEHRHQSALGLILDSDSLVTTGFAGAGATRTGAYDPNALGNNVIRTTLTNVPIACCGTGDQGHVGTFRVKARVFAGNATTSVRLAWREGDTPFVRNAFATPIKDQWTELDLGTITIPKAKAGAQRWEGWIEAKAATGTTLDVDFIALIPTERYGIARAPLKPVAKTFDAQDGFNQSAGVLTGKTLPIGGAWAVVTGSDADDFSVETAGKTAQRTALADSGTVFLGGRHVVATPSLSALVAQIDFRFNAETDTLNCGLHLRGVDALNFALANVEVRTPGTSFLAMHKVVAGSLTQLALYGAGGDPLLSLFVNTTYRLTARIDASGQFFLWLNEAEDSLDSPLLIGSDTALATAGALASGKVGIHDKAGTFQGPVTRNYDNFAAYNHEREIVVATSQSLEIRHDSTIRENAAGTIFGKPPLYRGSRFFIPPAGADGKTSRIAVKARRNDVAELPDDNIADSTKAQAFFTPRFLNAPR